MALVTGAGRGIGQVIARDLARAGADIAIFSRSGAADTVKLIEEEGGKALDIIADCTKEDQVTEGFKKILEVYGRIDVVVNNAGVCYHKDIFEAVYTTNLLMRSCDVLVTKPSELAFYPVPKLFIRRVGKHEMWGAIHSAEIGDGTLECRDIPHTIQMLDQFLETRLLDEMCEAIVLNKNMGIYDGAKKVVELAMGLKEE